MTRPAAAARRSACEAQVVTHKLCVTTRYSHGHTSCVTRDSTPALHPCSKLHLSQLHLRFACSVLSLEASINE